MTTACARTLPAAGRDLDKLAARPNASHRTSLEERRPAINRRVREPHAGAKRVEGKAARADGRAAIDRGFPCQGRCRHPRVIEARRPTRVVLAPQAPDGVRVAANHMQQVLRDKVAPDVQPLDRRGKVQRRPSQPLPQRARGTKAVGGRSFLKRGVEVLANQPG